VPMHRRILAAICWPLIILGALGMLSDNQVLWQISQWLRHHKPSSLS
jgi:hypothetical protein